MVSTFITIHGKEQTWLGLRAAFIYGCKHRQLGKTFVHGLLTAFAGLCTPRGIPSAGRVSDLALLYSI